MLHDTHSPSDGHIFHWPRLYDFVLRLLWRDSEYAYRDTVINFAGIRSSDTVLDVGSGTGTLAIAAARRVGPKGKVVGIDASPEMVGRARDKAGRSGMGVEFREALADDLPFPDLSFDALVCTTVLHCLPGERLGVAVHEMVRVLKSGGRLLLVDFGGPSHARGSFMSRMHLHREFDVHSIIPLLRETAATDIRSGDLGFSDLHYVSATKT